VAYLATQQQRQYDSTATLLAIVNQSIQPNCGIGSRERHQCIAQSFTISMLTEKDITMTESASTNAHPFIHEVKW
jgi:hypothetical protein